MSDQNERRRRDDGFWGMMLKFWPMLILGGGIAYQLIVKGQKLDATTETVKVSVDRITNVERAQAVQAQILSDVKESQSEMRRDIKEILRRVR